MISYHFYASPDASEPPSRWSYSFFGQADHFLDVVRYIEAIRQRLSPQTQTTIDELGAILPQDNVMPYRPIPDSYWNLCAAMYAYLYAHLADLGIDVAVAAGGLPNSISECLHGGLEYRTAERALLGVETDSRSFRPW